MISVFVLPSNTIFRKQREREWVRSRPRAKRERKGEREREKGRRESPLSVTHELRLRRWPRDFAPWPQIAVRLWLRIAPRSHPLTSPANPEARIARLRLRRLRTLRLCQLRMPSTSPRWHRSHWVCDWEMVGFWWIWLGLMNFFWLGFDEFDWICVYLLRNGIIYLFGSWENVRKCKKQEENVFSILFSATQPNTRKYFLKHF